MAGVAPPRFRHDPAGALKMLRWKKAKLDSPHHPNTPRQLQSP